MTVETFKVGEWEYQTSWERLVLPSTREGDAAFRVRYRKAGDRVFRSFLLLGVSGEEPSAELVLAGIQEHSAR